MNISNEKINFPDGLVGDLFTEPNAGYFFINNSTRQYFASREECLESLHDFLKKRASIKRETSSSSDNSGKRETSSNSDNSGKYPGLKTIVGLISILGYIVIIIGIGALILMVTKDNALMGFVALVVSVIISLPLLAFSNLIYVFIDIEYNTRKTREELQKSTK